MSTDVAEPATAPGPGWRRILLAGFVAGSFDLIFAFTWYGFQGATPVGILQSIASGWLGRAAFEGGWPAALLGAVSHYGILIVAAAMYAAAARRIPLLHRHAVLAGLAYGLAIQLTMKFVIVPLSAAPSFKGSTVNQIGQLAIHLFGVGLPIALLLRPARPRT